LGHVQCTRPGRRPLSDSRSRTAFVTTPE
jgi:hypothetical protein